MIYISVGSNIGNRINNLWDAVHLMRQHCLQNTRCSIIIETEAILPARAPADWNRPFLNMIVAGETALSPGALLQRLKKIEAAVGRASNYERWAPRVIDLDILYYNDEVVATKDLNIPHLELENRDFLQHLLALMGKEPWRSAPTVRFPFTRTYTLAPRLVGVVNVTKDSFSDGGRFYALNHAINQVIKLIEEGASVIELGAQSTRPGAHIQAIEAEYAKLDAVLRELAPIIADKKITISIDTFHASIVTRLIEKYAISWINDVRGNFDDHTLSTIAEAGCKFCLMHSLTIPPSRAHVVPLALNLTDYLLTWGEKSIDKLLTLGFALEDIILDPGIGFGKTAYQNIEILRHVEHLKALGCLIMIGHSRKSYMAAFSSEVNAYARDLETIGISLRIKDKVDFLRVHNVKDHMKALVAHHISQKILV